MKVGDLVTLNPKYFDANRPWLEVPTNVVGTIVHIDTLICVVEWSVNSFNPSDFTWSYNLNKLLPYQPKPKPKRKL